MLAFVFLALVAVASAQTARQGACPDLKPVDNFNVTAYLGTWYEVARYFTVLEKDGSCASAEYLQNSDIVTVKYAFVVNGVKTYLDGTVKLADDANNSGKIIISLKFGDISLDVTKYIIATDYSNYVIAYICKYDDKTNTHQDYLWVMSRTMKLEGDVEATVDAYLNTKSKEIDIKRFIYGNISEEACKYTITKQMTTPTIFEY